MGGKIDKKSFLEVIWHIWGFPDTSAGKESTCNVGDLGLIPGLGRSPGGGKGYPLQCSGLENSMDCIVHGITKSQTQLSDFYSLGTCAKIRKREVFFDSATPFAEIYHKEISISVEKCARERMSFQALFVLEN